MKYTLVASIFSFLITASVEGSYYSRKTSYSGDVVLRCESENKLVRKVMELASVDVWGVHADGVDMKMSRNVARVVLQYLPDQCFVLVENVENHVIKAEEYMFSREQKMKAWRVDNGLDVLFQDVDVDEINNEAWHHEYHNYQSIMGWYKNLANEHSDLVKYKTIGQTAGGRDMIAVQITASTSQRNKVYMQCLIHAREWISGAMCMYQADMLVKGYKKDRKIKKLLDEMEFLIVPIVNPDGYDYTWTTNRLWRKNRVENSGSHCIGVDLNRNFDSGWGEGGRTSDNKCSETYHGGDAASELEVQHIKKYFKANAPIVAAIDFHSYGQLILRPYGWTRAHAQHEDFLALVGKRMAERMEKKYVSKKSIDLYQACGIASDWFYSKDAATNNKGKRPASFTIELRDRGNNGFLLPASEIIPTAKEVKKAVIYLVNSVQKTPLEY